MSRDGSSSESFVVRPVRPSLLLDDTDDCMITPPLAAQSTPVVNSSDHVVLPKSALPPFAENCENQYGRYVPNSLTISHVLRKDATGEALQFAITPTKIAEVPVVKQLVGDVSEYQLPTGLPLIHGKTEEGIDMVSCRSYSLRIQVGDGPLEDFTLFPLSPLKGKRLPAVSGFVERFKQTADVAKIVDELPLYEKRGEIAVVNSDIPRRADMTRTPDQNTVMGKSAVDMYKNVLIKYDHVFSEKFKATLRVAAFTPWRGNTIFEAQYRPEHLHLLSYGLYPVDGEDNNPQQVRNLGDASRFNNTRMMIQERTVERVIRRYPQTAKASIGGVFSMLLDTEVINTIYYWIKIQVGDFKVIFPQKVDPHEKDPQFVKASDMGMIVELICLMIQNIAPLSIQKINVTGINARQVFPAHFFAKKEMAVEKRMREETDPGSCL